MGPPLTPTLTAGEISVKYNSQHSNNERKNMNASASLRKLKELDQLEKRIKATKAPSQRMLQLIEQERTQLLTGANENETITSK